MRKTFRFKTPCLLVSILWTFAIPTPVRAWGPEGHRIVARIAARHLKTNLKTTTFISKILRSDPHDPENCAKTSSLEERLACISVWADNIRTDPRFQYTRNQHFVSIPINVSAFDRHYEPERDCRNEDCIVVAIEKYSRTLVDPKQSPSDRALALKFLVHLIGDLHQPLHVATDNRVDTSGGTRPATDLGGNLKIVNWLGESSDQFGCLNLHQVWDTNIVARATLDDRKYSGELMAGLSRKNIPFYQQGTVLKWVDESYRLAVIKAYGLLPQPVSEEFCDRGGTCGPCGSRSQNETRHGLRYYLKEDYYGSNKEVVETQLVRAGLRLAKILDSAANGKLK